MHRRLMESGRHVGEWNDEFNAVIGAMVALIGRICIRTVEFA